MIRGPAGFGKTTFLKRLAWEAAVSFDCLVLCHRAGGSLRLPPLEELYSYTGRRIYLIVDRAAFHVGEIAELYRGACKKRIPLTIFTAERDNEWNVRCDDLDEIVDEVFELGRFSKDDIIELVEKLDSHHLLGRLATIPKDGRVHEFEVRAERQILVMLYELTRGQPFEDIVIDEYKRIIPNEAQNLYLDVCCFNRLSVPVRAGLISRVSKIEFSEFKARLLSPLDKIVFAYRDEYVSDMMYSCRHPTIAQIVFERILATPEERYDALVRIMQALNISYSSDYEAFKRIANGREIAQMFSSQELGRHLFDAAQLAAGEDANLFQQRAIFELRHSGGDKKRALSLITQAEKLRSGDKSIRHTKATILRALANEEHNDLRRAELRRQCRAILAPLTGQDATQPHGFHTIALLAFDEVREEKDRIEAYSQAGGSLEAIERVFLERLGDLQKAIQAGLSRFPGEPRLLSVEADYLVLLSKSDQAFRSLERAFRKNPRIDWIATRLARMYVDRDNYKQAVETLRTCLWNNASSKDANYRIGILLSESHDEAERNSAIEYFRRAFTIGDANYNAQSWYARALFLGKFYVEANRIFAHLRRVALPSELKRRTFAIIKDWTPPKLRRPRQAWPS